MQGDLRQEIVRIQKIYDTLFHFIFRSTFLLCRHEAKPKNIIEKIYFPSSVETKQNFQGASMLKWRALLRVEKKNGENWDPPSSNDLHFVLAWQHKDYIK